MISVWHDYNSRVSEIDKYFNFLTSEIDRDDDRELLKILKANGFLMLYNLLESTVRNAIEELHASISDDGLKYAELISEIRAIWIEHHYRKFKDKKATTITNDIENILEDIFNVSYSDYIKQLKSNDLSGNLDRRKVDDLAIKYGFKKNTKIEGTELYTIRKTRNNLAHGNKSYSDVGKNYDKPGMIRFKRICILYLKELLITIERYINEKKYKRESTT